jgi:tripartite-type tricarboxylate transporter receptor subunit TctC
MVSPRFIAVNLFYRQNRFLPLDFAPSAANKETLSMTPLRNVLRAAALCAVAIVARSPANAQGDFPSRPIQLVTVQSAGTTTDLVARSIADKLGQRLGTAVLVVNKPGSGGNIATDYVAKAPPDGYTLLVTNLAMAANPFLYRSLPYDPSRDFTGVGLLGESPYLVIVNNELGARTIGEFIAYAKQHPRKVNYASGGIGSGTHLTCALFAARAGIEMTHVPYAQSAAIGPDLLSNRVQVMCPPPPSAPQIVREGKTTVIGSTGLTDMTEPYAAPSIAKAAHIDFESTNWNGLFAPAKTPKRVLEKLQGALAQTLADPEVQQRFKTMGMTPNPLIGEKFNAFFRGEVAKWGPIVKATGAKLD